MEEKKKEEDENIFSYSGKIYGSASLDRETISFLVGKKLIQARRDNVTFEITPKKRTPKAFIYKDGDENIETRRVVIKVRSQATLKGAGYS